MIEFTLNGQTVTTDDPPESPLLWVVRDTFKLKGSKYGCGKGLCGACTMQLGDYAIRSCITPISVVRNQSVRTIEGLGSVEQPHLLQRIWAQTSVPQCGYCQSGQLMAADALLKSTPNPSEAEIDAAMRGNICRCGTYPRIKKAILLAAEEARGATT